MAWMISVGQDRRGQEGERRKEEGQSSPEIKMLRVYRSISEDSGRGSLKLLFGGGEKAGKKLFLSEDMGIKTWMPMT